MEQGEDLDWVGRQGAGGPVPSASGPGRLGGVYESMTTVTVNRLGFSAR